MLDFEEYTSPLSTVSLEDWSRLTKTQRRILTLRCTTFLPRELVAKDLGIELSEVVSAENNALIFLSRTAYRAFQAKELKKPKRRKRRPTLTSDNNPRLRPLIAAKIGAGNLKKLMDGFRGTRLYIPKISTEEHPIAILLGASVAQCLSEHFGSYEVTFPKGTRQELAKRTRQELKVRDESIREEYYAGDRVSVIAKRKGLSERRIHSIISQVPRMKQVVHESV